uniref:Major latex n=1 Tax=Solanum tuberosum TaxID=4113 RepID=M1ALE5_SOLTU
MGLKYVLCAKIEMKANKDVFHDVFTNKPHHVSTMSPLHIQGLELLEGDIGIVGSKICWNYTLGRWGKEDLQTILETIDHEKKVLTLKEFEGDVTDKYDSYKATLHIETKDEIDLVSWTLEYERPNENVPELINLLNFVVGMTKAIDDHHAN